MKNLSKHLSYSEKENQLNLSFSSNGPFYHLCTNGEETQVIFTSDEDFKHAMNFVAYAAKFISGVSIYTFTIMINHFHFIISGPKEKVVEFYKLFRSKLSRYLTQKEIYVDLHSVEYQVIEIKTLSSLRNEIVYTNRNGYVADSSCSFFSYRWGAGAYFFNPISRLIKGERYDSLTYREQRSIVSARKSELLNDCRIYDGVILPTSYCKIDEAESYFQDAHMYSHMISRNSEAYAEISKQIKDRIFLTYNELHSVVSSLCKEKYSQNVPSLIPADAKLEMAKYMKSKYNATLSQIRTILKLDSSIINSLFPSV